MKGVEIILRGLVQGIGFRQFIAENAKDLGIYGFVRNLDDGSVFIKAEGIGRRVDELVQIASEGTNKTKIDERTIRFVEYSGTLRSFSIDK